MCSRGIVVICNLGLGKKKTRQDDPFALRLRRALGFVTVTRHIRHRPSFRRLITPDGHIIYKAVQATAFYLAVADVWESETKNRRDAVLHSARVRATDDDDSTFLKSSPNRSAGISSNVSDVRFSRSADELRRGTWCTEDGFTSAPLV